LATCIICPVCGEAGNLQSAAEKKLIPCNVRAFRERRFEVWRCSGCRSIHASEDADLDLYYSRYPFQNHRLDFHAWVGYSNRLRFLRQAGLQPHHKILDYGCGSGLFVEFLREKGYAQAQGYDRFVSRYADPATLSDQYDVVVSHDVVEHAEDPRDFFAAMTQLAVDGGLVAIGTPNADHLDLNGDLLTPELQQPYHRHIFSEKALVSLAEEFGLFPERTYRRFYFDSLYPSVNTRFMWAYIAEKGGMIDAAVEPPDPLLVWKSPRLIFYALFGYFFPPRGNILVGFRHNAAKARQGMPALRRDAAGVR
jgi:2-polyprenyl-3-methyl-5-hydroxy-6-metoxy-1,4-benzoquinol methylase